MNLKKLKVFSENLQPVDLAIYLLVAAFIFRFSLVVLQFSEGHFLVAPGGDPINHLAKIEEILQGKIIGGSHSYPPLYHILVATLSKMMRTDPIEIMKATSVLLLFVPIPFLYKLTKEFFGFWPAFWATLVFTLASANPFLGFVDGNYPDLLNYGIFIPLAFMSVVRGLRGQDTVKNIIASLIFLSLGVFTHHLTSIFTIVILAAYLTIIWIMRRYYPEYCKNEFPNHKKITTFFLVYSFIIYTIARIAFGSSLQGTLSSALSFRSPITSKVFSNPPRYEDIGALITPFVFYLGALGFVYLLLTIRNRMPEKILLLTWVSILWILSRTALSGLAPRYLRELSAPLCILTGIIISYFVSQGKDRIQKVAICAMFGFLVYTNIIQINAPPFLLQQGGFSDMVWYRDVDDDKVNYFKENIPDRSVIIANPSNPYIPYFLNKRANNKLEFKVIAEVPDIKAEKDLNKKSAIVEEFLYANNVNYLFIGKTPKNNIDEKTFSEFNNYERVTGFFNAYKYYDGNLIKQFEDGSKLILVKR
ncbi:MAG: DUF6541 family protein [Patescibacteria group bacterium]|jgi:hypothetical protein